MSFASDMKGFSIKIEKMTPAIMVGVTNRIHQSIVGTGSADPLTGAPGQPVDTGFLRNSWTVSVTGGVGTVQTNAAYAVPIEHGVGPHGPMKVRSAVGGFHSVKMTIAHASLIQAEVVRTLGGSA